jgi:hypothetical protein
MYLPPVMEYLASKRFKHPAELFTCFKKALEEELLFTFMLKRERFIAFTYKYFGFKKE